jgi:hypothetical protein
MTTPAPDDVCQHENCGKPLKSHLAGRYCFLVPHRDDDDQESTQTFLAPPAKAFACPFCISTEPHEHEGVNEFRPSDAEVASLRAQLAAKEARIGELEKQVAELEDEIRGRGERD